MKTTYIEQPCKNLLHKITKTNLPFSWGVNPYRGCLHSCTYCFARYTHSYLDLNTTDEFDTKIFVKTNAARVLRKEFSHPKWQKDLVNLGSVCDPYQPAERKYEITQEILQVFKQFRNPITIATKSDLILRDVDILKDISKVAFIDILFSISSINKNAQRELEPRAPSTQRRLDAIKQLHESGLRVGVLAMPIVPFINDTPEEIEELYKAIKNAQADFVIPGVLYIQGPTKKRFFEYIETQHPELLDQYKEFFKGRSPPKDYRTEKQTLFRQLIKKYQLNNYRKYQQDSQPKQVSLENYIKK
ncbi:MAG: radical SAM protein [Candidatus Heimdallarchaeota archaeon]